MTDSNPIQPEGATRYPILDMGDEEFESMTARLIRLEFPNAFKPAKTRDGGADMALPRLGGGYKRCWQSKHFRGAIKWEQCKRSLAAALENWPDISQYTFCFPRELNNREQKTFDKHFRGAEVKVEVNHWNGEELQARLRGSDEGQRVARTFFKNVELDLANVNRAIAAGGQLETPDDALDRLGSVGGFLASKDAYFSYPAAMHESDEPGPPVTPGAVMTYDTTEGEITRRIDVVPRDGEAMERHGPKLVIEAAEGEAGARAAAQLEEALREGKAIEIGEGLDLTFTQMPPAFSDVVGKRFAGSVQLGEPERVLRRRAVPPWRARLEANTDRGTASVDVELRQAETVPDGWNDAFVGALGGMAVTALLRQRDDTGELQWNFRHQRDTSPVHEQLAALNFLRAFSGAGSFVVTALGQSTLPELRGQTETLPDPVPPSLLTFLEGVRAIEQWTDTEFELPRELSGQDARDVATVAAIIRDGGRSVTWHDIEVVVEEAGVQPLQDGHLIRVEREAAAAVLGRVVELGYTRVDLHGYTVASTKPAPDNPGHYEVRLEPSTDENSHSFEHLDKASTPTTPEARRPPPPPPRKARRKRGGKRKKRGR